MSARFDRWRLWLVAKLIGMALFLHLTVQTWIEPELVNEPGASCGEFIFWGMSGLPVFLLFMLAHFASGLVAHRQRVRIGSWRGEILFGITLLCWIAAFFFDSAHHGA